MINGVTPLVEIPLGADTWSTPLWVKEHGLIVAATRDGRISAWRPSGEPVWSKQVGDVITASPNLVRLAAGPHVLIGSHDGWLSALAAADGATLWRRPLGSMIRATVAVVEGVLNGGNDMPASGPQVFAASYGDYLWRIDAATGNVRWKKWLPRHVWARGRGVVSCPIVADVDGDGQLEVVIGSRSWRLFCVSAETGTLRWWRGFDYGIDSTCTVAEIDGSPVLLVGTGESLEGLGDRAIVALAGADGAQRWSTQVGGGVDASATCFTIDGRTRVVQTSLADAACHCLDLVTGRIEWTYRMGPTEACTHQATNTCVLNGTDGYFTERACCRSYTTPLVRDLDGDGHLEVLVGSMNGLVYALDAETGAEKGRLDARESVRGSPIHADVDGDGYAELIIPSMRRLLLFRTQSTDRDWPMFKGEPSLSGIATPRLDRRIERPRAHASELSVRGRLLFQWVALDLGYFLKTRIDKHVLNRLGRRRMTYWY